MDGPKERAKKIKKPFHLKKADVDLDGYRKELQDRSPAHLAQRAVTALKSSRQFHIYLLLQSVAAFCGYGQVMMCIGTYRRLSSDWPGRPY
jgi:hypothetical protein